MTTRFNLSFAAHLRHLHSTRNFYIRKKPIKVEWQIINYPFSESHDMFYRKCFHESFTIFSIGSGHCGLSSIYYPATLRKALKSLCSKRICIKTYIPKPYDIESTHYQFKNPLESDLYNNIAKTAFKF